MLRRSHKKSRHGCTTCKRRHVKCDETRPSCVNCVIANLGCSFIQAKLDLPLRGRSSSAASSGATSLLDTGQPIPSRESPFVNILHLELFYNYTSESSDFIIRDGSAQDGYLAISQAMLDFPYLMHQMLATSALHLSIRRPAKSKIYQDESVKLQRQALKLFGELVTDINSENIISVFAFSGLLGRHSFCETFQMEDNDLEVFLDKLVQSIKMLQGVRSVIEGWYEFLQTSPIRSLLFDLPDLPEQADDVLDQLEKFRIEIPRFPGLNQSQIEICEETVGHLKVVYTSTLACSASQKPFRAQMVTIWPTIVSAAYIDLLIDRKPEALLILAYFAVVLHKCQSFWAVQNSGYQLFSAVSKYLGQEWDGFLLWPKLIIMGH